MAPRDATRSLASCGALVAYASNGGYLVLFGTGKLIEQSDRSAWHEVDDALVAYQANQRRRDSLQQAVMHSQHALDSVHQQYAQGRRALQQSGV